MKRALKIVGIVVAVILLIVIALPFLINVNSFRPKLESELTRRSAARSKSAISASRSYREAFRPRTFRSRMILHSAKTLSFGPSR